MVSAALVDCGMYGTLQMRQSSHTLSVLSQRLASTLSRVHLFRLTLRRSLRCWLVRLGCALVVGVGGGQRAFASMEAAYEHDDLLDSIPVLQCQWSLPAIPRSPSRACELPFDSHAVSFLSSVVRFGRYRVGLGQRQRHVAAVLDHVRVRDSHRRYSVGAISACRRGHADSRAISPRPPLPCSGHDAAVHPGAFQQPTKATQVKRPVSDALQTHRKKALFSLEILSRDADSDCQNATLVCPHTTVRLT
eukprot:1321276-Rhodomonas_salina.2